MKRNLSASITNRAMMMINLHLSGVIIFDDAMIVIEVTKLQPEDEVNIMMLRSKHQLSQDVANMHEREQCWEEKPSFLVPSLPSSSAVARHSAMHLHPCQGSPRLHNHQKKQPRGTTSVMVELLHAVPYV